MSRIIMSIVISLALWFLLLSAVEWVFDINWLSTGKYYILIFLFVVFGSINMAIGKKK